MIRMIPSASAGHAKAYFQEALSKADYYLNDQELNGRFSGKLAERLGIAGKAEKEAFYALCENRHPASGAKLTPRDSQSRIVGYDINFHCPKSVSILHVLAGDDHILRAFEASMNDTMRDIERDAKTRVRRGGKQEDRETGELAWAEFIHQTARPVEDHAPDPHLHGHCFVFNATWDGEEGKFKAAKFRDIKRDMPYYQAAFHKRLADRLTAQGYMVRRTRNSFEVENVPQAAVDHFSKRTDQIGRVAKEKGITDAKDLDALGARTRSAKRKGLGMAELKKIWREDLQRLEIGETEWEAVVKSPLTPALSHKGRGSADAKGCIDYALKHCFERASVMEMRKLLSLAFRYAIGQAQVKLEELEREFDNRGDIITINQGEKKLCTTKEVLAEEKRMVELAREGLGKMTPLYPAPPLLDMTLNAQQKGAIAHITTTANRICIVRGAAGTGKTKMMQEARNCFVAVGKKMIVAAPTAEASRGVLKTEGFKEAETVARLLADEELKERLRGQVLWVDEAGLLGTQDMVKLLALAKEKNARLILGGDTRQHASVVRGDALRILNTVGGIASAELTAIQRQKTEAYRKIVKDLAEGNIAEGFMKLDATGAIKNAADGQLVEDYVAALKAKKTALVISPTHKEGDAVTADIRTALRSRKMIGKKEIKAARLRNLNLTEAERMDARNYETGQIIQFMQNVKLAKRGSQWQVKKIKGGTVTIENRETGNTIPLPKARAKSFAVFEQARIGVSKGDKIRITQNAFDNKKKRLNNGATLEVVSVSRLGKIVLRNKASQARYEVGKDFGHLAHAHCITSYAAQGKTVDAVFIAQPAATFNATDAKQFYVSVSRGRESVSIYTDDKAELLRRASEYGDRLSALELVGGRKAHAHHVARHQREAATEKAPERMRMPPKDIITATRSRNEKHQAPDLEYE